jgi:hypothetical protein
MIQLTCNQCKAHLSVDDAFAGGACRCQFCGTIQTVPAKRRVAPAATATSAKTLYQTQPRADGLSGTGLDQLASAVATSSGLSSGRLRAADAATRAASNNTRKLSPGVLLAIAVGILVMLGLLLWLMSGNGKSTTAPDASRAAPIAPTEHATRIPSFCGVAINEHVVVYVIDRGNATAECFDRLKQACFRSVGSLGPDRKFQILFWNNGSDDAFYPTTIPTFASPANIDAARKALDDVTAHGQSDVTSALTKAIASNPDAIVLATAKGNELDDSFVTHVEKIRGASHPKIFTFGVGSGDPGTALKTIATRTGGTFTAVAPAALREASE